MHPNFNQWIHCDYLKTVITMYSVCPHWVFGSLPPVIQVNGCDICELNVNHTKARVIGVGTGNDWKQRWEAEQKTNLERETR